MALQKTKRVKWVDCNYWVITKYNRDKKENKTDVVMSLFFDKTAREQSLDNYLYEETKSIVWWWYDYTEMYTKVKESKKAYSYMIPTNEDGTVWEAVITWEVETNFFVNAIDD